MIIAFLIHLFFVHLFFVFYSSAQDHVYFNDLEQSLRDLEELVIKDMLARYENIPECERTELLARIKSARNAIKRDLLNDFDPDKQRYCFIPRQDTVTRDLLQERHFTPEMIEHYTARYAQMLNIKEGMVSTVCKQLDAKILAQVEQEGLLPNKNIIYYSLDYINEQEKEFPIIARAILHELIHLIEGHGLTKNLCADLIERYCEDNDIINIQMKQLKMINEAIADIAPLMFSSDISSIAKIEEYFYNKGYLKISETDIQLKPSLYYEYNQNIYPHHNHNKSLDEWFQFFKDSRMRRMHVSTVKYWATGCVVLLCTSMISYFITPKKEG